MKLLFYKGKSGTWLDKLICYVTKSEYSHVEFVSRDDGTVYECWSSSNRDGGIRKTYITVNPEHWTLLELPTADAVNTNWFLERTGQKYDYVGLLCPILKTSLFSSKSKWFCSEAIAEVLGHKDSWRYTPEMLFQIYSKKAKDGNKV